MSAKTLIIATAALAASTAMTLPAFAAGGDGTGPNGPNPPPAAQTMPMRAQIMFNLLDTNHDGAIDKDEFAVLSNAIFSALDTNHDGKLTQDEMGGRFGAMLGQRGGRGGPGMGPGRNWQDRDGRGWGQGQRDDRPGPRNGMGRMGFNGQGPQGQPGFGPRGPQNFANLDTNGDGAISLDEFKAHMPVPGQGPATAVVRAMHSGRAEGDRWNGS